MESPLLPWFAYDEIVTVFVIQWSRTLWIVSVKYNETVVVLSATRLGKNGVITHEDC